MEKTTQQQNSRLFDILTALVVLAIIIFASIWVSNQLAVGEPTVLIVLIASSITALATGFGAMPFLFVQDIKQSWLGMGNALAAGLMVGASIGLVMEGIMLEEIDNALIRVVIGMVLGVVLVFAANKLLEDRDDEFQIGQVQGADAIQMLIIIGIMTVHSFAEGIGVGVSYGGDNAFGLLITSAIAIHNIPEGLAISLILIPRGTSVSKAAWWSVFTSLPQPIMAVPAFLFVLAFRPFLPIGLGLAAGAMFWMVFDELLPSALEELPGKKVYPIMVFAIIAMLAFQYFVGG